MEIIQAIDVKTKKEFYLVAAEKDEKTIYTLDFDKDEAVRKMEELLRCEDV